MQDMEFTEAVKGASTGEKIDLLFAMLAELLDRAHRIDAGGRNAFDRACIEQALDLVCFLRDSLRPDHASRFNLAFRKFYNALHRAIIDANRDGNAGRLIDARRAVLKLTGPLYGFEFLRNCADESLFTDKALEKAILGVSALPFLGELQLAEADLLRTASAGAGR